MEVGGGWVGVGWSINPRRTEALLQKKPAASVCADDFKIETESPPPPRNNSKGKFPSAPRIDYSHAARDLENSIKVVVQRIHKFSPLQSESRRGRSPDQCRPRLTIYFLKSVRKK